MKTLKELCTEYSFQHENEYFEMLLNTWYNGQFTSLRRLFNDMDNSGKKIFLTWVQFAELLPKDIKNITLFFINELLK